MAAFNVERITHVHHWNDTLFSFKTTRDTALRFKNGQFVMIGLEVNGKPLMRAYSIASANYEEELEFFSIKVQDGPLTSILQKVQVGDEILISKKPTGTLVHDDLLPGKNLYLLSSGTGLDISELAYQDLILDELPNNEWFEDLMIKEKLIYFPTVTREPFHTQGRVTTHIEEGTLFEKIGLPKFNRETDRAMLCGSPAFLKDVAALLDQHGLVESPRMGVMGDYVIERAFVEK